MWASQWALRFLPCFCYDEKAATSRIHPRNSLPLFARSLSCYFPPGFAPHGHQAIKALQEEAFRFTTCPEDAVPETTECRRREGGYFEVVSSLCVPTATRYCSAHDGQAHPSTAASSGTPSDTFDGERIVSTPNTADHLGALGDCRSWRVLPARVALSLRQERLTPSRPPRPSRAPPVAPVDSVCRLRLAIQGVWASIRASHPGSLGPGHCPSESSTVMVGWNGYDATVGPSLEWPVKVPSAESVQCSSLRTDILLEVPRHERSGLVLTLRVVAAPSPETDSRASKDSAAAEAAVAGAVTLGSVSIDWDGLSCLPVCYTGYFVDTPTTASPIQPPAVVDLELLACASPASSSVATANVHSGDSVACYKPATSALRRSAPDESGTPREIGFCGRRTAGLFLRVGLQLETSPVSIPHALALSPVAARGPSKASEAARSASSRAGVDRSGKGSPPAGLFSPGDFRDPCRRQRLPYLRFSWPWDDFWAASIERRTSLIPRKPWRMGSRTSVVWTSKRVSTSDGITTREGEVTGRLPLTLSGLDGSVEWPGSQELRNPTAEAVFSKASVDSAFGAMSPSRCENGQQPHHPVVLVEAFDMGPYARMEHRAAATVQRVWRRALDAVRSAREWWEYYATLDRHNAAVRVQAHYRGWKGRQASVVVKQEAAIRGAAAATVQRRWRCEAVGTAMPHSERPGVEPRRAVGKGKAVISQHATLG